MRNRVLLIMSVVSSMLISDGLALSPEEIWDKAKVVEETATYTARNNGDDVKVQIFQKANADGTVFRRSDYQSSLGNSTVLINLSGEYEIYHPSKRMIKKTYNMASLIPDFSKDAKYSVQRKTLNGIDCYVVTQKVEPTPEIIEKICAAIPESMQKLVPDIKQDVLENMFPASTRKYIGKDDFFTYSIETFLLNGKLKSRYTYMDVKLNAAIDNDLFLLPRGYKLEIANTYEEFAEKDKVITDQLIDSAIKASPHSRKANHGEIHEGFFAFILRLVEQNTVIISRVLFWSAILIIVGVIIYKIKNK